ncbi:MAG: FkbM family methyltransferase, partial [Planctomycetota bacterium]
RIGGDTASFLSNDAAHQRSWRQQIKDGTRIQVRVRDMDSLLAESGVECIDIAVLDVEGAESDVLDGFDLARWGVRCLVIEDLSRGRNRVLRVSLGEQGYDHAMRIGLNDVFVKRGDAIAQRAHVLCGQP